MGTGNTGDRSRQLAERLQRSIDSKEYQYHVWSKASVGEAFATVAREIFQRSMPKNYDYRADVDTQRRLIRLWKHTERWRHECIDEAIDRVAGIPGAGLRRTELLSAIGRTMGLTDGQTVYTVEELLPYVRPKDKAALLQFLRWVFESYQYNHAKIFGAIPNFVSYKAAYNPVLASILPETRSSENGPLGPTIQETITIPSLSILRRMSADNLVKIRTSTGEDYLDALQDWYSDRYDDAKANAVRRNLHNYANNLTQEAMTIQGFFPVRAQALLGNRRAVTNILLSGAIGGASVSSFIDAALLGHSESQLLAISGGYQDS